MRLGYYYLTKRSQARYNAEWRIPKGNKDRNAFSRHPYLYLVQRFATVKATQRNIRLLQEQFVREAKK
jgi:hypothetical protein